MADTIRARITLRAAQGLTLTLTLEGTPANPAFQADAYQNDAYQVGGVEYPRNLSLINPTRP